MQQPAKNIAVLGSTGSIGVNTLEVIAASGGRLRAAALAARNSTQVLLEQARQFRPEFVVVTDGEAAARQDWSSLPKETKLLVGPAELSRVAGEKEIDTVMAAIVGAAGLESTWAALQAGKRVALANKETLVMAGQQVMQLAEKTGAKLLPVDSEHSAVFQCLQAGKRNEVQRIILTASGGPFRNFTAEQLARVTVEQALAHPTWDMGPKITIDSATMINKALEIVEARWLFDIPPEQIDVVAHPQSIVHSFVEFVDGSTMAQLSPPDMRLPIQYALYYPERTQGISPKLNIAQCGRLDFEPADAERFPALALGYEAARTGGTTGAVLNAANEEAVSSFLAGELDFAEIVPVCRSIVEHHTFEPQPSLSRLVEVDRWAAPGGFTLGMYLIAALPWLLNPANWGVVLQVAAGLGFVIFVHELGHFLVAKACGVKCEKFYLGFDIYGLKLAKFQWGETEYGIGILPLGGYVKMLGQDDNPARMAEETKRSQLAAQGATAGSSSGVSGAFATAEKAPPLTHGDLPPEPVSDPHVPYDPRSYMAQSVPKRMAIISAGVIMNVIFAFFMASLAYGLGVKETPCIVGNLVPGGAAWLAGLEPGDVVKRIGKVENPRFHDLQTGVTLGDLENGVEFEIYRPSTEKTFVVTLHPDKSLGVPMIGVVGPSTTELDSREASPTFKFSPARRADPKFKAGDKFTQIDDVKINSYGDIQRALVQFIDKQINTTIVRKPAKKDETPNGTPVQPVVENTAVGSTALRDFGLIMKMEPVSAIRPDSVAQASLMLVGDTILEVDGKPVGNPITLPDRIRRAAVDGKTVSIKVDRKSVDGKTHTPTLKEISPVVPKSYDELYPTGPLSVPAMGFAYQVTTKVVGVVPGSPADEAKISAGDEITSARLIPPKKTVGNDDDEESGSGEPIDFVKDPAWAYFNWALLPFTNPAAKWELEVKTGDKTRKVQLATVELKDDGGEIVHTPNRGFLFQPLTDLRTADSFAQALQLGGQKTIDNLLLVYRFLQKIGQKQISVKLLGGPVEIFRQAGRSAQQGFSDFLLFLTMLSANLAVINFLPIPVLDGGHMVFLLYELIRRKPASERVVVAFTYLGLIFILSLMLFVLALDTGLISRR